MIEAMGKASERFYLEAIQIGCHPFIEFTGLINEYIQMCRHTKKQGQDFAVSNRHSGVPLLAKDHHVRYLAEKFDCIFGGMLSDTTNRAIFFKAMEWPEKPKESLPMDPAERAKLRPQNFKDLSPEEQWAIDKRLKILDWEGPRA